MSSPVDITNPFNLLFAVIGGVIGVWLGIKLVRRQPWAVDAFAVWRDRYLAWSDVRRSAPRRVQSFGQGDGRAPEMRIDSVPSLEPAALDSAPAAISAVEPALLQLDGLATNAVGGSVAERTSPGQGGRRWRSLATRFWRAAGRANRVYAVLLALLFIWAGAVTTLSTHEGGVSGQPTARNLVTVACFLLICYLLWRSAELIDHDGLSRLLVGIFYALLGIVTLGLGLIPLAVAIFVTPAPVVPLEASASPASRSSGQRSLVVIVVLLLILGLALGFLSPRR